MAVMRLKHVHTYVDRHGRKRSYLRIPGRPGMKLDGCAGSPEFMASYNAAIANLPPRDRPGDGRPGSIRALLETYYKSSDFRAGIKSDATRKSHKAVLERFAAMDFGGVRVDLLPAAGMERDDLSALLDDLSDKPGAYETTLKRVRKLFNFATERKLATENPAKGIKTIRESDGHEAWSDPDIAQYEAAWPSGSRERLAMVLLLYTGQRRSDVAPMGRQHVRDNMISVTQEKTKKRLWIPIHAKLAAELPVEGLTFLLTDYGQPFSVAGFGNWFSAKARAAGLQKRTAHGLRKASARRLAEGGCSEHEIMAITGHSSLSEVQHYTKSASQITLAQQAMERLK
jgi:integrase